jgi:hypothetical protein
MPRYEYKVVPAPTKGLKAKGVKGAEARFSHAIQELMNGLAGDGWEYQRAETLPSIERAGLTSTTTEWRNLLVFRRLCENDTEAFAPELLPPPEVVSVTTSEPTGQAEKVGDPTVKDSPETTKGASTQETQAPVSEEKTPDHDDGPLDNGVEDTSDIDGVSTTLGNLAASRKDAKTDT